MKIKKVMMNKYTMKVLFILLISVFFSGCTLKGKSNYNIIIDEKGQLQKITTFHEVDSTVINFYPVTGGVESILSFKNGVPQKNKLELFEDGGIKLVYQLVPHADSSLIGQVYMFDSKQCLVENGSLFAIVSKDSNNLSTIKYTAGFGLDSIHVYEITEFNNKTYSFHVKSEISAKIDKDGRFPVIVYPQNTSTILFKFIGTKQNEEFNFFY